MKKGIGINVLSTCRQMQEDCRSVMLRLQEAGCAWFEGISDWGAAPYTMEAAGFPGWDPDSFAERVSFMRSAGMPMTGTFVCDGELLAQADQMGRFFAENGIGWATVSFPGYSGIDDVYAKITMLRETADILRPYGVRILQHNHEYDMAMIRDRDGREKPVLEVFLEQLSSQEMMLETDPGWLLYAGYDPVEYVRTHADRIGAVHCKDICAQYAFVPRQEIFVPTGQGVIDYPGILAALSEENIQRIHFLLDQDASQGDIVEDLILSLAYLKELFDRYPGS